MSKKKGQLIVALDVATFEQARGLVDVLSEEVDIFKVGSELFTACGPVAVRYLQSRGKKVFLDLKYHDIPNTVANAVNAAVRLGEDVHEMVDQNQKPRKLDRGVFMLTVHAAGGEEMLKQAVQSAAQMAENIKVKKPLIVGITVLTSEGTTGDDTQKMVLKRAELAKRCGLDGVVASSQEADLLRRKLGEDFIIVTPGIRPQGADAHDQKRITTPARAIVQGSHFLVVGRPITQASDPLAETKKILNEMEKARR